MLDEILQETDLRLRRSERLLIISHVRPDGDAVGSMLGLGLTLQAAGKQVEMVLEDGVPLSFRHLPGADLVKTAPTETPDCVVVVDCSDLLRTGNVLRHYPVVHVNIDHHPTNVRFAEINLVVETAVSTTEILYRLLTETGWEIPDTAAAALLTGLVTDTIGFQTPNITAGALRSAADLVERGLDLSQLYRKALMEKSYEALRYWGEGLRTIRRENGIVWVSLDLEARKAAGYPGRDDADLVNQLSSVRGSNIRVVFIQQSEDEVKVSWRSQPGYDVSAVALQFGGGGHHNAAGATITGSMEDVELRVLEATRGLMKK